MIIHEREYGSEHPEGVTMLANSIKNDATVLQISGWIEMPVPFKRALIVHEWEYGSEHREEVTMLANCIKNDATILQISAWIEMPVFLRDSVDH